MHVWTVKSFAFAATAAADAVAATAQQKLKCGVGTHIVHSPAIVHGPRDINDYRVGTRTNVHRAHSMLLNDRR